MKWPSTIGSNHWIFARWAVSFLWGYSSLEFDGFLYIIMGFKNNFYQCHKHPHSPSPKKKSILSWLKLKATFPMSKLPPPLPLKKGLIGGGRRVYLEEISPPFHGRIETKTEHFDEKTISQKKNIQTQKKTDVRYDWTPQSNHTFKNKKQPSPRTSVFTKRCFLGAWNSGCKKQKC